MTRSGSRSRTATPTCGPTRAGPWNKTARACVTARLWVCADGFHSALRAQILAISRPGHTLMGAQRKPVSAQDLGVHQGVLRLGAHGGEHGVLGQPPLQRETRACKQWRGALVVGTARRPDA